MPKVFHCKKNKNAKYVGRQRYGYHFGNPFSYKEDTAASIIVSSREEAVVRYKTWLLGETDGTIEQDRRKWILNNLHTLTGQDLSCWCAPLLCHASVLIELSN
jgi:hypothetical protein